MPKQGVFNDAAKWNDGNNKNREGKGDADDGAAMAVDDASDAQAELEEDNKDEKHQLGVIAS